MTTHRFIVTIDVDANVLSDEYLADIRESVSLALADAADDAYPQFTFDLSKTIND